MFKRIMVPLDGSARAERALPVAARIARASGGSLFLYRAVAMPGTYGAIYANIPVGQMLIEEETAGARAYLDELKQSELIRDIPVECAAEVGVPASLILERAAARQVELIVICSHGRTGLGRWVLGSVAEHISHHAPVPVLVLREHGKSPLDSPDPEHLLRVLVPLDGSQLAESALRPAALLAMALAAPQSAGLHLTLVVDPFEADVRQGVPEALVVDAAKGYLIGVTNRLHTEHPQLTITWSVAVNADVAAGILQVAERGEDTAGAGPFGGCDLIAMATHGRTGLERWALGSMAERVLHATKLPVMLVRPRHMEAEATTEKDAAIPDNSIAPLTTFTALF
jgi:nucleotide-binding universal stress UspA family protein